MVPPWPLRAKRQAAVVRLGACWERRRLLGVAQAFRKWHATSADVRLIELVGTTLEHTRRTGAAYVLWNVMSRASWRRTAKAFHRWQDSTGWDNEEDFGDADGSSDGWARVADWAYNSRAARPPSLPPPQQLGVSPWAAARRRK